MYENQTKIGKLKNGKAVYRNERTGEIRVEWGFLYLLLPSPDERMEIDLLFGEK